MENNRESFERLLPYKEAVADLYQAEVAHDPDTIAYARLGAGTLFILAETGEVKGLSVASIVPGAFEYKLDLLSGEEEGGDFEYAEDYEGDEEGEEDGDDEEDDGDDEDWDAELDDPLRPNDLRRAVGITKLPFVINELGKLGMNIEGLSPGEISDLVRFLEDSQASRVDFGGKDRSNYNSFIALAENMGIDIKRLRKMSSAAEGQTGFLLGLNEEFLNKAGEDAWPKNKGVRGNNYPCRYSRVFPQIEHITKIIPLDEESKKIMDFLRGLRSGKELEVKKDIEENMEAVKSSVDDLEID